MAEETHLPPDTLPNDDFGGFLGRRLKSYQDGVLGLASLRALPLGAGAPGSDVVNRTAEFNGSLQSLLSFRGGHDPASPPSLHREVDPGATHEASPPPAQPAEEASGAPAPAGPIAFGSETWFARMAQRQAAIEQRKRDTTPLVTGPSAAMIEAALGIDRSAPARSPGDQPVRRRSVVQEMSGAGIEFDQERAATPAAVNTDAQALREAPGPAPAEASPSAAPPSIEGAAATGQADSDPHPEPTMGPPLVQRRRPRRQSTQSEAPVQRLAEASPVAATVEDSPATAPSSAGPSPARQRQQVPSPATSEGSPEVQPTPDPGAGAAHPSTAGTPPVVRRAVVAAPPANRQDPPDEGRQGARRVTPGPVRPPQGTALTPGTARPDAAAGEPPPPLDAVDSGEDTGERDTGEPATPSTSAAPPIAREVAVEAPASAPLPPVSQQLPGVVPSPAPVDAGTAAAAAFGAINTTGASEGAPEPAATPEPTPADPAVRRRAEAAATSASPTVAAIEALQPEGSSPGAAGLGAGSQALDPGARIGEASPGDAPTESPAVRPATAQQSPVPLESAGSEPARSGPEPINGTGSDLRDVAPADAAETVRRIVAPGTTVPPAETTPETEQAEVRAAAGPQVVPGSEAAMSQPAAERQEPPGPPSPGSVQRSASGEPGVVEAQSSVAPGAPEPTAQGNLQAVAAATDPRPMIGGSETAATDSAAPIQREAEPPDATVRRRVDPEEPAPTHATDLALAPSPSQSAEAPGRSPSAAEPAAASEAAEEPLDDGAPGALPITGEAESQGQAAAGPRGDVQRIAASPPPTAGGIAPSTDVSGSTGSNEPPTTMSAPAGSPRAESQPGSAQAEAPVRRTVAAPSPARDAAGGTGDGPGSNPAERDLGTPAPVPSASLPAGTLPSGGTPTATPAPATGTEPRTAFGDDTATRSAPSTDSDSPAPIETTAESVSEVASSDPGSSTATQAATTNPEPAIQRRVAPVQPTPGTGADPELVDAPRPALAPAATASSTSAPPNPAPPSGEAPPQETEPAPTATLEAATAPLEQRPAIDAPATSTHLASGRTDAPAPVQRRSAAPETATVSPAGSATSASPAPMPASTGEPATGPAEVAGPAKPASLDALVFAAEPPATRRERVVVAPDAIEATSFEPVPALAAPVTSSQPLQRTFEPAPGFNGFQGIAAASTPLPTPAAAPTGAAHQVLRAAAPVEMPLAPVQREPAVAAGSATGQIQRVLPENQAVDNNPEKPSAPAIDYDRMAEEVWPRIRRKLRIERERERGLPY